MRTRIMHQKTKELIDALNEWCTREYGRQSEVARFLGVSRGLVGDWRSGRRMPNADQAFMLIDFLRVRRKARH